MNKLRKYLLIGLTTLSLGTATCGALADPAGADGSPFAEHRAQRLAALHDQLQLTPAQEQAWVTFVGQITPTAQSTPANWSEWSMLSAPARLQKEIALMQAHLNYLTNQVLPAVTTFYAVLTSAQQKIFDQQFGWHRHHGGPHW